MPYQINEKETYLHIDWNGVLTLDDLERIRSDIRGHMMGNHSLLGTLHTFDKVTDCAFQPIAAYDHALKLKATHIPKKSKSASVAPSKVSYGYAKLFQELNRNPNLEMQIFRTEKQALAWLGA